jgi:cytoskeletal protein CcmA (bactofilin family)
MFKNTQINEKEIETIIGHSVKVKGNFITKGSMQIDGELEGTLKIGNDLIVGEGAKIIANVNASRIMVSGNIKGNLKASESLEITETARVEGDVESKLLSVDAGAQINGKIKMAELTAQEKNQIIEDAEEEELEKDESEEEK